MNHSSRKLGLFKLNRLRVIAKRLGLVNPLRLAKPSNWRSLRATDDEIAAQTEYALTGGVHFQSWLQTMGLSTSGARIAELGPGVVFGAAAFLRSAGAEVTLLDRWLAGWTPGYHDIFYRALIQRIETEFPANDCSILRKMAADGCYGPQTLNALQAPLEALGNVPDAAFDAVISNAVLEHIADPVQAFAELFRITRPGGVGVHQVDYRDHRNFEAPLEHLLLSAKKFDKINRHVHMEFGSQRRQADYATLLTQAGFVVEAYHQSDTASEAYLDDFLARAVTDGRDFLSGPPRDELADLGGLFLLRRP